MDNPGKQLQPDTDFPLMVFPLEAEPALVESYMSCISLHLDLSLLHYKFPLCRADRNEPMLWKNL